MLTCSLKQLVRFGDHNPETKQNVSNFYETALLRDCSVVLPIEDAQNRQIQWTVQLTPPLSSGGYVLYKKLVTQLMVKWTQMEKERDDLLLEKIVTDQERDVLLEQLEQYRANEMRLKAQIEEMTTAKDGQIAALKENEEALIEQVERQNAELMDKLNRMASHDEKVVNEDEMDEMIRVHEVERAKLKEELRRVRDNEKALGAEITTLHRLFENHTPRRAPGSLPISIPQSQSCTLLPALGCSLDRSIKPFNDEAATESVVGVPVVQC